MQQEAPTFRCPFCGDELSVIYRASLPSGLEICTFCRDEGQVVDPFQGVTDRETRAWILRVEGYKVAEIAGMMGVSERTIKTWSRNVAARILGKDRQEQEVK